MVKKILSVLGIIGIMSTMAVNTAFAAPVDDENLLQTPTFTTNQDTATYQGTAKMVASFTLAESAKVEAKILYRMAGVSDVTVKDLTLPPAQCDVLGNCHPSTITVQWDGTKNDGAPAVQTDTLGSFVLSVKATVNPADPTKIDTDELTGVKVGLVILNNSPTFSSPWDPAKGNLTLTYALTKPATVAAKVMDGTTIEIKTFPPANTASGTLTWDQITDKDAFPLPKTYTVKFSADTVNASDKSLTVAYTDTLAPKLSAVTSSKTSFTSDTESTTFSFTLTNDAYVLAEIYDSTNLTTPVFTSSDFDGDTLIQGGASTLSFDWNGKNSLCGFVKGGGYLAKITARNTTGVDSVSSLSAVTVSTVSTSVCLPGSSKITAVELDPSASQSSQWDPLEDKLDISWKTTVDFDSFTVNAIKGNDDPIEIYEESDIDADDYDAEFEGKNDDDEYVDAGKWTLVFIGENESGTYYIEKTFYVKYEKPEIDDTFVTKKSIDPDIGEGTYFAFILKTDAKVDVEVLKGSKSKVDLLEDEEVKKDVWYAVYWDGKDDDGDDFDYDDTFKIRLTAKSLGDEDVSVTATETVDLDEDDVSSSKSNVTMDSLVPPVVEQGDDVALTFNVEDDAELRVGIWKGTSTSGSPEVELQAYKSSKAGDYEFTWNTRDEDGKLVKKGFYTYKVFTKKGSTTNVESESGQFVVGDVGDVFGGATEETVVDDEDVVAPKTPVTACGFSDVSASSKNCAAIKWAKEQGIFEGDDAGFRPYDAINRVEVLAVLFRAFGFPVYGDDGTNLGWKDTIKGSWYMPYLRSGKMYGMVSGDASGTVRPADPVIRAELLKFVYEAAKKAGTSSVSVCTLNPYADVFADAWYLNYVCQAKTDKLFDVIGDMFMPGEAATRAEVAEALYRLLK